MMPRGSRRFSLWLLLAFGAHARPAYAEEGTPIARETPYLERDVLREGTSRSHTVRGTFDEGTATAFGLGYVHTWNSWFARGGVGGHLWLGLGLDGRVATRNFGSLDGALVYGVARMSGMSDTGGFGLELAFGMGAGRPTGPFVSAAPAVFFGLYFVELGYSYQFPLPGMDRPDWLSSHQFSVRVHVPVSTYAHTETRKTCEATGPCR